MYLELNKNVLNMLQRKQKISRKVITLEMQKFSIQFNILFYLMLWSTQEALIENKRISSILNLQSDLIIVVIN